MIFKNLSLSFDTKNLENNIEKIHFELDPNFILKSRKVFLSIMFMYILYNIITLLFFSDTNLPFFFGLLNNEPIYETGYIEIGAVIFAALLSPILSILIVIFFITFFYLLLNFILFFIISILGSFEYLVISPILKRYFFSILYQYMIEFPLKLPLLYLYHFVSLKDDNVSNPSQNI